MSTPLQDHPKETKENRRKAGRIVEKWYRMLTGTSENMKDINRVEQAKAKLYSEPPPSKKKQAATGEGDGLDKKKTGQGGSWMQVRIPYPEQNSFVRRPKTSADVEIKSLAEVKDKKAEAKNRQERMEDKVKHGAARKRARNKARESEVSIEGRGMEKYI